MTGYQCLTILNRKKMYKIITNLFGIHLEEYQSSERYYKNHFLLFLLQLISHFIMVFIFSLLFENRNTAHIVRIVGVLFFILYNILVFRRRLPLKLYLFGQFLCILVLTLGVVLNVFKKEIDDKLLMDEYFMEQNDPEIKQLRERIAANDSSIVSLQKQLELELTGQDGRVLGYGPRAKELEMNMDKLKEENSYIENKILQRKDLFTSIEQKNIFDRIEIANDLVTNSWSRFFVVTLIFLFIAFIQISLVFFYGGKK